MATTALTIKSQELDVMHLGEVLTKSGYFQDTREAAQAVVKILAGQELGFGPIASMTGINIVKGRVSLSANLIAAAIKRSGKYDYRVIELSDTVCRIKFFENGKELGESTFTMDDARRAKLAGKDNWQQYPRNMLFSRNMSNGAKWYCPDIFDGPIYTPDELGAEVDGETGEVINVTPEVTPEPIQLSSVVAQAEPSPPQPENGAAKYERPYLPETLREKIHNYAVTLKGHGLYLDKETGEPLPARLHPVQDAADILTAKWIELLGEKSSSAEADYEDSLRWLFKKRTVDDIEAAQVAALIKMLFNGSGEVNWGSQVLEVAAEELWLLADEARDQIPF